MNFPAWIPCPCCDEFWCRIHEEHVFECDCPAIEEWTCDPYAAGGPPYVSPLRCRSRRVSS